MLHDPRVNALVPVHDIHRHPGLSRAGVPGALDGAETAARLLQLDKVDLTLVQHHAVRSSCVHRSNLHAHAARFLNGSPQPRLACALKRHRAAPSRIATPSSSRDVMTSGQ